jgi:hypothetical protein
MSRTEFPKRKTLIRAALLAALSCMLPIAAAHATPVTYTLSGNGAGAINGTAFSGNFSFVFGSDTTDVAPFGSEFIDNTFTAATFSEGGTNYTVGPIFGIIADPISPGFAGILNPNVSSALVVTDGDLVGYNLLSSLIASSTDASGGLSNELGGSGFSLDGGADTLIFTADTSLTFTAVVGSPVPEPSSIALLAAGVLGIGLIYRRSGQRTAALRMNSNG